MVAIRLAAREFMTESKDSTADFGKGGAQEKSAAGVRIVAYRGDNLLTIMILNVDQARDL